MNLMNNWKVPLADVTLGPEETAAVTEVLQSGWLSMGPKTQEFEDRFSPFLGVKHAFAVANGTAALHLACEVLGLGPGDEVLCPALTFVASANAILYTGARPVFVDITGPHDLNLSVADAAAKVSERTRAIMVVHYGGYPADMDAIAALAARHGLKIIEDCAHAPGAVYHAAQGPRLAGVLSDVGCFSFFANKNLTTGEGGMVVTDDDELAGKIKTARSHGMTTLTWDRHRGHSFSYDVVARGYNYRLDEMRAALGLVQLHKLDVRQRPAAGVDPGLPGPVTEPGPPGDPFSVTPPPVGPPSLPDPAAGAVANDRISWPPWPGRVSRPASIIRRSILLLLPGTLAPGARSPPAPHRRRRAPGWSPCPSIRPWPGSSWIPSVAAVCGYWR